MAYFYPFVSDSNNPVTYQTATCIKILTLVSSSLEAFKPQDVCPALLLSAELAAPGGQMNTTLDGGAAWPNISCSSLTEELLIRAAVESLLLAGLSVSCDVQLLHELADSHWPVCMAYIHV